MIAQISFNSWHFAGMVKLTKNLVSARYKSSDGFTAEEMFTGPTNKRLGLLVRDEKGHSIGLVQHVSQLP